MISTRLELPDHFYLVSCYREIKDPDALAVYVKIGGPAVVAIKHLDPSSLMSDHVCCPDANVLSSAS